MVLFSSFVDKECSLACTDCGLKFTHWEVFKTHLHQHALEEEEDEDEAAQMGDNSNPAAELDSGRLDSGENRDEDTGSEADGYDMSSSSQTEPSGLMQGVGVATASVTTKRQKGYACLVCGKVYTYLVSFKKHQRLHENQPSTTKSVQNRHKYECPDCGMSFIRHARLLGHMRVHRSRKSLKSKPPRCDQCNTDFTSIKSWMIHVDLHKQKPFWCLSCTKGFRDEESLDKHLHSHYLRQRQKDTHTGAKPYQCKLRGKSFSHPGNLISHQKNQKRLIFTSVREEPEMDTNMDELPGKEERVENSETQNPCEDAEFEDHSNSEESDCGEPVHRFKYSKPHGSAGPDLLDESNSETVQPRTGQELDESELQEIQMHREHKYWEWECCECDMGFDEVGKLHLHYIKHATGELPIPQDDIEG